MGTESLAAIARRAAEQLKQGDTRTLYESFAPSTKRALTYPHFVAALDQSRQAYGELLAIGEVEMHQQAGVELAKVSVTFERVEASLLVVADDSGLTTFRLIAQAPPVYWIAPRYVKEKSYTQTTVDVAGLPGSLLVPTKRRGPVPAVVLLHGSGPNDHDGTVGGCKPLLDIAAGLASNGVATLRFDKRSFAAPGSIDMATVTVEQEVLADARVAVDVVAEHRAVDSAKVFVAGHSLSGYLIPRMLDEGLGVAGVVLLAAPARSIPELAVDQLRYLGAPAEMITAAEAAAAAVVKVTKRTPASKLPFGVAASYWLDLRGYDPVDALCRSTVPALLVFGGRDYQVPSGEAELWRSGLGSRAAPTTIRSYPVANHLLVDGKGEPGPVEYAEIGHVTKEVITDMAKFVRAS